MYANKKQASALVAENAVVPLLVMDTMKYNVENFKEELHQYLTVLALHKGTLAAPDSGLTGTGAMAGKKVGSAYGEEEGDKGG